MLELKKKHAIYSFNQYVTLSHMKAELPALLKGICHKERTYHQIQFGRVEQYINGNETGAGFFDLL